MFDRKLLYTLMSIGAVVLVTLALELSSDRQGPMMPENPPDAAGETTAAAPRAIQVPQERAPRIASSEREPAYILREWDGYIAVFIEGECEPQMILEQQVRFLPDIDRLHLREGINVSSRAELAALIEDYIS